jgi:predicted AAA+ superfamily ATPase
MALICNKILIYLPFKRYILQNVLQKLYKYLLEWKRKPDHKPLIIRGARQVGKTTLVNEFGRNSGISYL